MNFDGVNDYYPTLYPNMATTGGNLMQRTRCPYFRDNFSACNKRERIEISLQRRAVLDAVARKTAVRHSTEESTARLRKTIAQGAKAGRWIVDPGQLPIPRAAHMTPSMPTPT